ncbi:hypothetical protein TNCV_4000241 [Trichonephila clavipes]|nr:hypothetical protein TNCV_4000241 [Trichonephila clavipes]
MIKVPFSGRGECAYSKEGENSCNTDRNDRRKMERGGEDQISSSTNHIDGRPELPNLEFALELAWNLFTSPRTGCG